MIISHKIDEFLFTIFPELTGGGNDLIINTLKEYYKSGPFTPNVTIKDNWVTIEIDVNSIINQEVEFRKTVTLCEKGNFQEAKPILSSLIKVNPTNSEYHRIMGQIYSEEGNQDEAINCLIDSLRWDSRNGWALLMMGNIFSKFKSDIPTAMKYYDQALAVNPNDNITINNIGANLMQQGKTEEAKLYFNQALKIDNKYSNTHYALSLTYEMEGDLVASFEFGLNTLKLCNVRDGFFSNVFNHTADVAKKIMDTTDISNLINNYKSKLEFDCDKLIEIIKDDEIQTAAKFEFAENYNREKHLVKYKPSYKAVEHLIMHELVHLDFATKARQIDANMLFISNQSHQNIFLKSIKSDLQKLEKLGIPDESISKYSNELFHGINRQIFNAPIDLFIEDFLFKNFNELKPFQFISLLNLIEEGIQAVTNDKIVELSPKSILSKSKIYNIIGALQFKDLFGIDFISFYKATTSELNQANELYNEYLEYSQDKQPGEEYELIKNWSEDLKINEYFELVAESSYQLKNSDLNSILESIENDPYGIKTPDPEREKEFESFLKNQEAIGVNMAVAMFMVDALEYFNSMSKNEVKEIALEIAMQGTQGFSPEKNNYRISKIKNKTFSGYHILAYYYVSWAIALPEMLSELQLPFDEEYKIALSLSNNK